MRLLLALIAMRLAGSQIFAATMIHAEIDATEISRGLLHSKMVFEVRPGPVKLWYPCWIPGVHGPVGPIQNMAGLRVQTRSGKSLKWTRDDLRVYQFSVEAPENEKEIEVQLDYICNQPSVNSTGVDSYGNHSLGIINLNTVLLYPDGVNVMEEPVEVRLRTPEGWKWGSSLTSTGSSDGWVKFAACSFEEAVDSPIILGQFLRTFDLRKTAPTVQAHFGSESESAIQLDEKYQQQLSKLTDEAMALFGAANYSAYHFIVGASDLIPGIGLEHVFSSLNVAGERDFVDEKKRKTRAAYLLPHEYVHSWCGKYRRPAGMATPNYNDDRHTELLWIYEGLTQYLGEVLMVRSGQASLDEYRQMFAAKLSRLIHTTGRRWRALEDTAVVSWQLREKSKSWGLERRGQDYYNEGLLVWMEIDGLIRSKTDGKKSLDDFCRKFFAPQPGKPRVATYELGEVIADLKELADVDWESLIRERVSQPRENLSLDFLQTLGYGLEYSNKPSEMLEELEKSRKSISAMDSLGLTFSEDGKISEIVQGLAADKAGIAPGMKVEAINSRRFSKERLQDALVESVTQRKIDFLVTEGDRYRTISVPYADGARYLQLVRAKERPDMLAEILRPRSK